MDEEIKEEMTAEKKKAPKGKIILILVLVLVLAVAATVGVIYLKTINSPEHKAGAAINNGDIDGMIDIVNEDPALRDSATLSDELNLYLDELQRNFLEGKLEYSVVNTELSKIRNAGVTGTLEKLNSVSTFVEKLNNSRTNFGSAESFFASENYVEAIAHYKKVVQEDPNYATAQTRVEDCYNNYRDAALKEAAALAVNGSYEEAIGLLEETLIILTNDSKINEQLILYRSDLDSKSRSDALASAKGYADAGDYANAIRALSAQYVANPSDYQVSSAYESYCTSYEDQVMGEVDALATSKKYEEAIAKLDAALKVLANNQTFKDKRAVLEGARPVSLTSLTPINGGYTWNEGTPVDPFGNSYSGSQNFTINGSKDTWNDKEYFAEYRLYGKYTTLSGSLVPYMDMGQNGYCRVQVYADDVLKYTSEDIVRKTDAFNFEVDVAGADYIQIYVTAYTDTTNTSCYIIMYDCMLWPTME